MESLLSQLAWIYWDPNPNILTVPFINHPIRWYGICFVAGFLIGYYLGIKLFHDYLHREQPQLAPEKIKSLAQLIADRLLLFIIFGTIIGARLGHVFFYDWWRYQHHLLDIFKVWEGGLASHGGFIGAILGIYTYYRLGIKNNLPFFSF